MIPYIKVPDLNLLGLTLHPFGLLVATGVIIGTMLATRRARRRGFDVDKLNSFITWMLVVGFMGGHMLDEIFYHPDKLKAEPWTLFYLWEGLSSFGGFTGALIGIVLWKYFVWTPTSPDGKWGRVRVREHPMPILAFADIILAVFPVAWIFGRSGCSVVHDHPGAHAPVGALLAVEYGKGPSVHLGPIELVHGTAPQYDLGLLELMFTVVLAGLIALTWRKKLPVGTYVIVTSLAYAPVRFAMDFLRIQGSDIADPRYGALTPAQWECIALFSYGLYMLAYVVRAYRNKVDLTRGLMRAPATPELSAPAPSPS